VGCARARAAWPPGGPSQPMNWWNAPRTEHLTPAPVSSKPPCRRR
jgi:hypothetical protein